MNNDWNGFKGKIVGLKGLATIGISDIVGNAISVFFWFYIAATLDPHQYGQIQYFLGIVGTTFSIALIGTQNTMTVYSAKNANIQATLYLLSLIGGIVGFITLIFLFQRPDIGFLLFGYIISTTAIGDLLGRKLYTRYSRFVLIQKSLTVSLGIGFYHFFGFNEILYALALSYSLYVIPAYRIFKSTKTDFSFLRFNFNFIANNYAISLTGGLIGQIDKLINAVIIGFALLGSYSLALQIIAILTMTNEIFFKYLLSQDASGNRNTKLKKYLILMAVIVVGVALTLSPIIIPVFFPKYTDVVAMIQIMSFSVISSAISLVLMSQLLGNKQSKFVLIGSITALLVLITGMIALGSLFGTTGVAIAFVLSSISNCMCLFYGSRKQKGDNLIVR
jgi:O-antigen/teichoic acid export membrane protein